MPTVSFTTSGALRKSALRQANERLVLDSIRRTPGISRAEIARTTGFSRTSVTFVVNRLLKSRLILEEKIENGLQAGRPPTALQLNAQSMLAIGVEIARPRSGVVLVDLNGKVIDRRTIPWDKDVDAFFDEIRMAIRDVTVSFKPSRILGVGVSLPGTIDKSVGRVVGAEGLDWFNIDVGTRLRHKFKWPFFFENDANLSALAEQWLSSNAESLRYFVYVRTQGGVGTGVVVDGRILHGVASAGAEFGHVMLYPDGRSCQCGNRGCWEQYASDAALTREYRELSGESIDDCLLIVKRAREKDAIALLALRKTASFLALGFVNLVVALNPQAIIMGEPYASAWDLVDDVVLGELDRRVPAYSLRNLRLLPSRTGADSALRGAAALVLAHFFTRFDHTKDDSLPIGVSIEAHA
ncbi:MAG TPA: ROK family transcriptional regulator [Bryobacteraceae bacterium]|nr:ROK family transcriptional regulator [Bryobacteraceae bacterium]